MIHSYNADGTKRIAFYLKGTCGEKVSWTLNAHGVVAVSGRGEMETKYGGLFGYSSYSDLVTEVNVKTGVTSVSDYAFSLSRWPILSGKSIMKHLPGPESQVSRSRQV